MSFTIYGHPFKEGSGGWKYLVRDEVGSCKSMLKTAGAQILVLLGFPHVPVNHIVVSYKLKFRNLVLLPWRFKKHKLHSAALPEHGSLDYAYAERHVPR